MVMWRFPSNDYGENKGINDSGIAMFRGTPLKSLAREICQNSLDAAKQDKVIIEFNLFKIPTKDIPGVSVLKDAFLKCKEFWSIQKGSTTKDFFSNAIKIVENDETVVLRISDFNTSGLLGSREEINTDWTNLTKSSGASDKKGTAGGSYGIGKYAPFACSDYATVFYSTYDINKEEAYQGISRLVTFRREDGTTTQGIGYYGNEHNTPVYEQLYLDPNFKRSDVQFGTDIYICGYKFGDEDWEKGIIISILDGFLGAIWNENLEVIVGNKEIKKENLKHLIEEYNDELTGNTQKYYELLVSDETQWLSEDFNRLGNIKLGILLGDQDAPRKVAMIRKTGMKILEKDRFHSRVPFTGIMFLEGKKLNERLRLIENPEHTEWQPERATNPIQAKELVKALYSKIRQFIEEIITSSSVKEIDAIGVGTFLPDIDDKEENKADEEVVSNKILDVDKKIVKKKTTAGQKNGKIESKDSENDYDYYHMEPYGDEEEWFHNGGKVINPGPKAGQEAHIEEGEDKKRPKKTEVALTKFVPVCVDKDKGIYVCVLEPSVNSDEGEIHIFLSAETQSYAVKIINASVNGGTTVSVKDNIISNLKLKKGSSLRIKIEIDYFDICSLEVKLYAVKK